MKLDVKYTKSNVKKLFDGVLLELKQKYVGSALGTAWVFIYPAMQLSIYAALYAFIFRVRPSGLTEWTYILLVFSGLVPLLTFSEMLTSATNSLSLNKSLLLNTVFPAILIPVRYAIASHLPGLAGLLITVVYSIYLERTDFFVLLLLPFFWLMLMLFCIGIGWIFSLLSLVLKDIQQIIGIMIMLLIVTSPFAFTPEMVPTALKAIIFFNPMTYFVLVFQSIICYGSLPPVWLILANIGLTVGTFLCGLLVFQTVK